MTVALVRGFGFTVHKSTCHTIRRARGIKGLAPEIEESEVPAFLATRRMLEACRSCFPYLMLHDHRSPGAGSDDLGSHVQHEADHLPDGQQG